MKQKILFAIAMCCVLGFTSCNKILEIQPLDKISTDQLLSSQGGIKTLVARLYNRTPIEDFNYRPTGGFNVRGWQGLGQNINNISFYTDESQRSSGNGIGAVNDGWWPYADIREINLFMENILKAKTSGVLTEAQYMRLKSEAHFLRAYQYFSLAKRYGGVPLISEVLDSKYAPGTDNPELKIPRATEKATWNFILADLDQAVANLPAVVTSDDGVFRASKWAAYGLKSRAALFAASIAKYGSRVSLTGEAATSKLVGIDAADAGAFYTQAISASKAIIDGSGKTLFQPTPANSADAIKNFQNLFVTDNNIEVIFSKGYLDGTVTAGQGHSYDVFYNPGQTNAGFHKFGRFSPTLDIVDLFEDYSDNGTGASAPIVTRTDGNENYAIQNTNSMNVNLPYKKYNSLYEPFANKDARLLASVIVPGSVWKGQTIIIQGGLINQSGVSSIYADVSAPGKDSKTYYALGAQGATSFSGFLNMTQEDLANYTSSGFSVKKYLNEGKNVLGATESSATSYIDIRLAEIYLNYAEAVVESGTGDAALAAKLLNDLRRRAAHMDQIPLTVANVQKERRVEMAFEGTRYWDLIRRREFHTLFNQTRRKALIPMIDLRDASPKFIFVRFNNFFDENAGGRTFQEIAYYNGIVGRTSNNLVQNPGYN